MSTTRQQVLDTLAAAPQGLTSNQVTKTLRCASYSASGILSKLAAYGTIEKVTPIGRGKIVWRMKKPDALTMERV